MRIANALAAAIFTLAALAQLNDPDPLVWASFYAVAATIKPIQLRLRTQKNTAQDKALHG